MKRSILLGFATITVTMAATASAETRTIKATNKDHDTDTAVSTTHTTSAYSAPRHDVVESRAEERREVQGDRWTIAPLIGAATNGYGFGAGARVGYTFATPIYLGASFMYHAGSDDDRLSYAYYPSAELGYDIGAGPVLIRPYAGAGALMRGGASDTGLVYPGLTAHYLIPKSPAFVGADAKVLVPLEGSAAFSAAGTTGLSF